MQHWTMLKVKLHFSAVLEGLYVMHYFKMNFLSSHSIVLTDWVLREIGRFSEYVASLSLAIIDQLRTIMVVNWRLVAVAVEPLSLLYLPPVFVAMMIK